MKMGDFAQPFEDYKHDQRPGVGRTAFEADVTIERKINLRGELSLTRVLPSTMLQATQVHASDCA
jgi:hypothetical protein